MSASPTRPRRGGGRTEVPSAGGNGWTPRSVARRFAEVARHEGPRSLWFKLLGETVYRRLAVFELSGSPPTLTPARPVEMRPLTEDELEEYAAFAPGSDVRAMRDRIAAGQRCFVARLEGRIVHATWTAHGQLWSEYLGRELELASDEACTYDTLTAPESRGLGIGPAQRAWVARRLREQGLRRLLATIYPENAAGIRLVEKLGYRRIGVVGFVRLGRLRRDFVLVRPGEAPPGPRPAAP